MTKRQKRSIPRSKLNKLVKALGGRGQIAEAIGMSRPAVDRYFVGKGMRQETYNALMVLVKKHEAPSRRIPKTIEVLPEPPTLEEKGGHLFALLAKALERNSGVEALGAQLTRMEHRLDRIEANQQADMKAWRLEPAELVR